MSMVPLKKKYCHCSNSKFLLRLDVDAMKIEHSERVEEEPEDLAVNDEGEDELLCGAMDECMDESMNGEKSAKKIKND